MQVPIWKLDMVTSRKRPLPDSNRGWRICNPNLTFGWPSDTLRIAVFPGFHAHRIFRIFQTGQAKGDSLGDTSKIRSPSWLSSCPPFWARVMVPDCAPRGKTGCYGILPPAHFGGK